MMLLAVHGAMLAVLLGAEPVTVESTPPSGQARFRGALELAVVSFPSGTTGGGQDLFLNGLPLLSFDGGPDFGLELGAELRLRVFDDPPEQRTRDWNGVLRREDWDELSDFGQVLRVLRIGEEGGAFRLEAGAFGAYTLGNGQLLSRYSNRLNPNYHPAGGRLVLSIGAARIEGFASDVLGGRIFAGEVAVDLSRATGSDPKHDDRYHASLAVAHDFARAGGTSPGLTLAWLELDAALMREERARFTAYLGGGGRVQTDGSSLGATLGLAGEGEPKGMRLGGRLEVRKQNSGFRQGMIGFDYELARFSAIGLGLQPLAAEVLPDAFSLYAEFSTALGGDDAVSLTRPGVVLSASGEYFTFGRTQVDVSVMGRAFEGKGAGGVRFAVSGLGQAPRYLASTEVRYRFLPSLYGIATGGTVFFPQADGSLARGFYFGLGAGADFER